MWEGDEVIGQAQIPTQDTGSGSYIAVVKKGSKMSNAILKALTFVLCLGLLPAHAEKALGTPESVATFVVDLCVFPSSEGTGGQLHQAQERAAGTGLEAMVESTEMGMYGSQETIFVIVQKSIESLSCVVKIAPPFGNHETFEVIEAAFDAEFRGNFPGYNESIDDDPSPHVDGHDWIIRTEANDSVIIVIGFDTVDGITVAGITKKEYD